MKSVIKLISVALFLSFTICAPAQTASDYRDKANKGDAYNQCALGWCYENGRGVSQDYSQAVYWYKKAAEQGISSAQYNLGVCYCYGNGVSQDYSQAVYWFKKAAEQGDSSAQWNLGWCYLKGTGVSQDYSQAVYWYKKAAEQGYSSAQCNLGVCYENGTGVSQDYSQAVYWYKKAAEQGYSSAQYNLGVCYANGRGVSQDYSQAVYWYKKSAEQGQIQACNKLGLYYYDNKNFSEAFHWFYKSMEYGDGWAANRVGNMYCDGEGVTKDISKYIEYLRKSYDLGYHSIATILLDIYTYGSASWHAHGLDIAQDFDKAKQLRDSLLLTEESKEVKSDMNEPFFGLKKSTKTNNNTFALIISNTSCENYYRDDTFFRDAYCFNKVCKLPFGIPSKNVHELGNPTLANLMSELDWLKNVMDAYDGDAKIVFYYSGPGGTDETTTESFILPKDCDATDPSSGFALSELYEILGSMSAKSVLVFIDSNFNGTDRNGNMIVSSRGVKIKTKPTVPTGNMVVFNASQGNETAWTNKKYGVFTYFIAKTLIESQEDITLGELSEKVIKEVKRNVIMEHDVSQTPIILASPEVGADWKKWSINQ